MKSPLQAMRDLLAEDTRFKIEAYQFIRESLQYAHEHFAGDDDQDVPGEQKPGEQKPGEQKPSEQEHSEQKPSEQEHSEQEPSGEPSSGGKPSPRHVTGQQLCEACRLYAIEQYGYLAKIVLANWGIHSTSEFGELVYNLIRIEQMRKSDSDRREDFDDVYTFDNAFEPQFEFVANDDD